MRANRRVFFFLVAILTAALIAASVGWVRFYWSPLADQAACAPQRTDGDSDELPAACREELATIDSSPADASPDARKSDRGNSLRPRADYAAGGGYHSSPPASAYPDRAGIDGSRGQTQAPNQPPRGSDVDARPISSFNSGSDVARARSAEWNAPAPAAAQPRSARTVTLPVSVEDAVTSEALDSLKAVDALDLMRRLRSEKEAEQTAARRELLRRGFSEVDLDLARQLFSPDIAARKQLALAVPRLASVDAARWLMWLAADPQPEVRMAAITTLATTGDPRLLDRVEALARKDSDQQIQALADQIAKQRDLAMHPGGANPLR